MKLSFMKYFELLKKYLKKSRLHVFLLAIVMGFSIIIQLVNPQIVSYFIDGITKKKSTKELIIIAGIFIFSALIGQVLSIGATYISQNIGWKTTNILRLDLVKHCLGLDMTFFKEHQSGEIVERIDGDVTALFNFFSKLLVSFINNVLLMAGIIIIMLVQNVIVGISFIAFLILAFLVIWKTQGSTVDHFSKERENVTKFYGFLGEHIESTEDIKANGADHYVMSRFHNILKEWLPIRLRAHLSWYRIWITLEGIFGMGYVMIFTLGGYLMFTNKVSLGMVYLMINYVQLLEKPLEQLKEQLLDIQKATASIIRIEELFAIQSKVENHSNYIIKDEPIKLSVNQVSFEYEENVPVLKDVSFHLEPGKILGVLGPTGCGKTTLARLLVRFYDPCSGEIMLNQYSIKELSTKYLRNNIAYVTQDVQLFQASVRDNITFFNPSIDDSVIVQTIYDMGLKDWYENLSMGLDTQLKPGGGMSSGEAQLLTLVRVFLKDPKLIILDEASSRLDPVTEQLVDQALNKLLVGRSCIIIAHRLGTITRADDIMILDKGSIMEYGTREDLMKDNTSKLNQLLKCGVWEVLA
jgi:ATP-binding cassette, subfamily B, bacterial